MSPLRSLPAGKLFRRTRSRSSVFPFLSETISVCFACLFVPLIWPAVAGRHQRRADQSRGSIWAAQTETPPLRVAGDRLPDTPAHTGVLGPAALLAEGKNATQSHVDFSFRMESFCVHLFFFWGPAKEFKQTEQQVAAMAATRWRQELCQGGGHDVTGGLHAGTHWHWQWEGSAAPFQL